VATEQLFVSIVIILVAARILGEVFQRMGQPPLVGELFAGLIIGPSMLALVLPNPDLQAVAIGLITSILAPITSRPWVSSAKSKGSEAVMVKDPSGNEWQSEMA
jgi:hypothetical protein